MLFAVVFAFLLQVTSPLINMCPQFLIPVDGVSAVHRFEIAVTLATSARVVKPFTVKSGQCTVAKAAADI